MNDISSDDEKYTLVFPEIPMVSVIIPTFNRASFITEAIDSILMQAYSNLEVIVVDDHSTDDTEGIIKEMSVRYPEIVYLKNNHRKGPSGARNTGILAANGKYIAFLDSDDVWLPGHIERGIRFLEAHSDIFVLFGNFKVKGDPDKEGLHDFLDQKHVLDRMEKNRVEADIAILSGNVFEALIKENFFHVGTAIVRGDSAKSVLFDEGIRLSEDRDFAARLSKEGGASFACRYEPTFIQRRHEANLSDFNDTDIMLEAYRAHVYLFTRYLNELPLTRSEKQTLLRTIRKRLLSMAYRHRQQGDIGPALACVCKSVRYGLDHRQPTEIAKIVATAATLISPARDKNP